MLLPTCLLLPSADPAHLFSENERVPFPYISPSWLGLLHKDPVIQTQIKCMAIIYIQIETHRYINVGTKIDKCVSRSIHPSMHPSLPSPPLFVHSNSYLQYRKALRKTTYNLIHSYNIFSTPLLLVKRNFNLCDACLYLLAMPTKSLQGFR